MVVLDMSLEEQVGVVLVPAWWCCLCSFWYWRCCFLCCVDKMAEFQVARITTRHQGDATAVEMMKVIFMLNKESLNLLFFFGNSNVGI